MGEIRILKPGLKVPSNGENNMGKAAISSTSIQGDILAVIGAVGSYLELAGKLPLGGASVVLTLVGSVFSMFGRFKAKDPIKSIF